MAFTNPIRHRRFVEDHSQSRSVANDGTISHIPITVASEEPAVSIYGKVSAGGNTDTGVALYVEPHVAGAASGSIYGSAVSLVLDSGSTPATGGSLLTPQTNGIYDNGATLGAGVLPFIGMKCEGIWSTTPSVSYIFGLNNTVDTTAIFYTQDTGGDMGYLANAGTSGAKIGDVPLFSSSNGTLFYVRIYAARG